MKSENENNSLIELQETQKLCQLLIQTPHYKKIGSEGIYAIVQKARSVGVNPLDALNGSFYYVQGKVEMTAGMMNDLIRREGHSITKDKKSDDKICILHGKRKDNGDTWSESFSIEDAKLAGIYRNQWLKYPKDMLFARALSRLARQLFPDVIKGCYVDGEIKQAVGIDEKIEVKEIEIQEEAPMELDEMREILVNHVQLPHKEFLDEYLSHVKGRVKKPLREVLNSWLENPEPFVTHYTKWSDKKIIETNNDEVYEVI